MRNRGEPELSRSEERRIFRALYRYEIFCHLFGRTLRHRRGHRWGGLRGRQINEHLLCLFDPWEAEAIGCVDLFIRERYKLLFEEVKWDLSPQNPKYNKLPRGRHDRSFDLEGLFNGRCPKPASGLLR